MTDFLLLVLNSYISTVVFCRWQILSPFMVTVNMRNTMENIYNVRSPFS